MAARAIPFLPIGLLCPDRFYTLSKALEEGVARLHLEEIGVKLTTLSKKQADYLGVPVEGPYKAEHYRY